MSTLRKYNWEAAHIAVILGVITMQTLATHLFGTPWTQAHSPSPTAADLRPRRLVSSPPKPHPPPSDPRQVVVGPSGINNRYTLLSAERKPLAPTLDELTVRLHVASLATEPLVSPFASDMLELRSPGLEPIKPRAPFRTPIPAGEDRDQDVVFNVPTSLSLEKTSLHIHYYNYQKQIPLSLAGQRARN